MANNIDNVIHALLPLIEAMEQFGIPYYLGGSVASSTYGVSRPTQDADVVAEVQIKHVVSLVKRLEAEYYIDADMIRDAIHHQSSFNPHGIINVFPTQLHVFSLQHAIHLWNNECLPCSIARFISYFLHMTIIGREDIHYSVHTPTFPALTTMQGSQNPCPAILLVSPTEYILKMLLFHTE